MGPRSDNRGYAGCSPDALERICRASMGPRSDNRGYGERHGFAADHVVCFNGSTVR